MSGRMSDSIENQTLQEWKDMMFDGYTRDTGSWRVAGDWLYPGTGNRSFSQQDVAYHVCEANYEILRGECTTKRRYNSSISPIEEGCARCGDKIPDGIKMIMLLGKL